MSTGLQPDTGPCARVRRHSCNVPSGHAPGSSLRPPHLCQPVKVEDYIVLPLISNTEVHPENEADPWARLQASARPLPSSGPALPAMTGMKTSRPRAAARTRCPESAAFPPRDRENPRTPPYLRMPAAAAAAWGPRSRGPSLSPGNACGCKDTVPGKSSSPRAEA